MAIIQASPVKVSLPSYVGDMVSDLDSAVKTHVHVLSFTRRSEATSTPRAKVANYMSDRKFSNIGVASVIEVATKWTFIDYNDDDKMDLQSHSRAEKFSGRPRIITLCEFRSWFNGYTTNLKMKHGNKYTPYFGFTKL